VAALLLFASCGRVQFVQTPYAPSHVAVGYGDAEGLTVITWQLGGSADAAGATFELRQGQAWVPVNFDDAPYPAGPFSCVGHCFQYNLVGHYTLPEDGTVLRSLHPNHGVLVGSPVGMIDSITPLSFAPRPRVGNTTAELQIADPLAKLGAPAPRDFRWHVYRWSLNCPVDTSSWEGTARGDAVVDFQAPDASEHFCMALQPIPRHPLAPVTVTQEILMQPNLVSGRFTYDVPTETSPVLYQLIYDLEIPDPAHCDETMQRIQTIVGTALEARNAAHHAFPPVNLGLAPGGPGDGSQTKCQQSVQRRLDFNAVATSIIDYVNASVTESKGAGVVLVYVNNVSLPPPPALLYDLGQLHLMIGQDSRVKTFAWAIAPSVVTDAAPWDQKTAWITPTNAAFRDGVTSVANQLLPFVSLLEDQTQHHEFIDPKFANLAGELKICSYAPMAMAFFDNDLPALAPSMSSLFILAPADHFSFSVFFDPELLVSASVFVNQSATVRYEICSPAGWCNHPFQLASGEWIPLGWNNVPLCREAQ
jgi:hypothetical protein